MQFHEEYLDVLQNIEFGIVQVYREHTNLLDHDVISALEALIDYYRAQEVNRPTRHFNLSDRTMLVFDNVKDICEWRLGRISLKVEGEENDETNPEAITVNEIINCLKKYKTLRKSGINVVADKVIWILYLLLFNKT